MKTTKNLLTLAFAMFATFAFAQGTITGSSHDFTGAAWNNDTSGEICNACHTPHGATIITDAPLWDRVTTFDGSFVYTDYSSSTFTAGTAGTGTGGGVAVAYAGGSPTGVSLLCLTCHDGLTPLDSSGTDATVIGATFVKNGGSDDHPISIDYTTELIAADGGLNDIATASDLLSSSGTVECSSCHDVHNNGPGGAAGTGLYAADNTGSAMCLTCHAK